MVKIDIMYSLAIVFPVYNGLEHTKKCIPDLKSALEKVQDGLKASIVVVDDGSTDNTSEWIKQNYPETHVLKGDGSLWWSGGMNMGMQYAFDNLAVDYILCWNNDVIASEDYFIELYRIMNNNVNWDLVCAKVLRLGSENKIFAFGCYFSKFTGLIEINGHGDNSNDDRYTRKIEVDWAGGMGTLISGHIYKKVGLFDHVNFPQYKGDCDYCLRAKKAGFKIVAYPELQIWNDMENTGLNGQKYTWGNIRELLTSKKSHFNFQILMRMMRKHGLFTAWFIGPFVTYTKLFALLSRNWNKK